MFSTLKVVVLLGLTALTVNSIAAAKKSWWQTASFYQIYPRSFMDSDKDGVGDLKGITQRLDYLPSIGVKATWISPIFKSPMADFGYDISNFIEIDPIFGTNEDLEALVKKANSIGVKIILDFVPNHSSDQHDWFIQSVAGNTKYEDYYIWHPGKVSENGTRLPPSNWRSVFGGSAWKWMEERQAFYLHQFLEAQPDLNYRNPAVKEEMKNVLRFWLEKGVAGFRVDAVPYLYEVAADANGNYPDEPLKENVTDPNDPTGIERIYTFGQPESVDLIYEFREVLDEFRAKNGGDELILMAEAYAPHDFVMKLYGNGERSGAQIPFNFDLITEIDKRSKAVDYQNTINTWLGYMNENRTANWVLGNHDRNRIANRLGEKRVDLLNILLATLPGISVTYYGEEIGMTDIWLSWEDTIDPQACRTSPKQYESESRDPERSPFQWNSDKFAGFTNGNTTWLPVNENYTEVNVRTQRSNKGSHLNVFTELRKLREKPTLQNGETEVKASKKNVLAIKRSLSHQPTYVALLNLSKKKKVVNLQQFFNGLTLKMEIVIVGDQSHRRKGDISLSIAILLQPNEALVLRTAPIAPIAPIAKKVTDLQG